MNTKTISPRALSIIDQYKNFSVGTASCSIPYFNNKTIRARGALRAYVGKGSPKDIYEEVTASLTKEHVETGVLTSESLKKYLTDKNIGLDCSGLAYYILNAESEELGKGRIDKHLHFTNCGGLFGKIRCALRPVENCSVTTFSDNKNSRLILQKDICPGDFISMISRTNDRDHMLIVHQVEYQNFLPIKIHYTHTIAYPENGVYGTGLKQESIEIVSPEKDIIDCLWSEEKLHAKLTNYKVEIRRLNWL